MAKLIPLSRGLFVTVDDADYDWLMQWKWSALKVGRPGAVPKFYACRTIKRGEPGAGKMVLMHRQIMGDPLGKVVDHRDLDTLNCQRYNLRSCTQAGNCLNQRGHSDRAGSRFKGVWWHKRNKKWVASFRGKYLGIFADEEIAAAAYDSAALAYSPEMSLLNVDIGAAG